MRESPKRLNVIIATLALLCLVSAVPTVAPFPLYLKRAQKLGFPARDCAYCHTSAEGGDSYNARGNWLIQLKQIRRARQVDVSWLKQYNTVRDRNSTRETRPAPSITVSRRESGNVPSPAAKTTATPLEPWRTIGGKLVSNRILAQTSDGSKRFEL